MKTLQELMEKYDKVSMRKLAQSTNATYGVLLKRSKEPVVGQPYDPDVINYASLEEYFKLKEIDYTKLDWEALNTSANKTVLIKNHEEFKVGMKVYLRKEPTTPYEILIKTDTHIVIMLEGTSEPLAWSINTFMLNGPSLEPRAEKVEKSVE